MLPLRLIVALLAAPLAIAQPATPEQPLKPSDPWLLATEAKLRAKERAMDAVATGDPVAALVAVSEARLLDPDDADLKAARDRLAPTAVPAAITMADALLATGDAAEAVELLADIRAATNDESLLEPLALARARHLLQEAASHEAADRAEASKRMILLAANIKPDDPQVRAALERHGLAAPPSRPAATSSSSQEPAPAPISSQSTRLANQSIELDQLQRENERIDRRIDDLTLIITRMERDLTLPGSRGAADPAVTQLDRRIDDLRRELDRALADLNRRLQTVDRDISSLQRDIARLR